MKSKFQNKTICLDLYGSTPYKVKKGLVDLITSSGARVSFILNKNAFMLVKNDRTTLDSFKCRSAFKLGVPVVHVDYLYKCLDGQYADLKEYLIANAENESNFKQGRISKCKKREEVKRIIVDTSKLVVCGQKNFDGTLFDENNFTVVKWVVFTKIPDSSLTVFELQTSDSTSCKYNFRLRIQKLDKKNEDKGVEYILAENGFMLVGIFKHYAASYLNDKIYRYSSQLPNLACGSKQLQQVAWKSTIENVTGLGTPICDFIEYIWNEAIGDLEEFFGFDDANSFKSLTIEQIDKAECVLRRQQDDETKDYSDEFYGILPMKTEHRLSIGNNKQILFQRFEICQVIRDMVAINEATNWDIRASTESKYRSIGVHVVRLDETADEYLSIRSRLGERVRILNVYAVLRPNETIKFNDSLFNCRQLFHGTKARNLVGVLSRGLMLSHYTGVVRSDIGMLGNGIYFSDAAETSLKYTELSKLRNTRMIAVCDVALGNCKDYFDHDTSLTRAPDGYHSTHGVKSSDDKQSRFIDDEFVIYDSSQQKLRYLVELQASDADGSVKDIPLSLMSNQQNEQTMEVDNVEGSKVDVNETDKFEKNPVESSTTVAGLQSTKGESLPLKSIHIRVELLDMVSKVNIYQEYENSEDHPIEAKYIFPLDDDSNLAICNFEAFINGKHVIGICKEKEEARREYKEAVEKGHGAYLMDQESPELFKVNVGNLPPNCKCIIKITYVAELNVENEQLVFRLPNAVAAWKTINFKNEKLHESKNIITKCFDSLVGLCDASRISTSLKVAVKMPFEIRAIKSPTHLINTKRTSLQAVVELKEGESLFKAHLFLLLISMSAIHVPRMLVEDNQTCKHERACMIAFYPEFETVKDISPEIVFLLDSSNSMSSSFKQATKLLHLMIRKLETQKCTFNVITFGSTSQELFPFSFKNDKTNIGKAYSFLGELKPNRGNTDLLNAIKSYLLIEQASAQLVNFILISDGHVNEHELLLSRISSVKQQHRFFTCSVGSTSNKHLLKMISYSSNGSFNQFDANHQSKWSDKCNDIFDRVSQPPAIGNIKVEWETHGKEEKRIQLLNGSYELRLEAPSKISSIFNGRRQVVYGFIPNCVLATLKAQLSDPSQQEVSTVVNCPELMISKGTSIIHKLTAKALIDDWQYGVLCDDKYKNENIRAELKQSIIDLSTSYAITSEYTSFIAVEERDKSEINKKYGKNESTTPSIESLLETDVDAAAIDILPYMEYPVDVEEVMKTDSTTEQMLNELFDKYDDMNEEDQNEINSLLTKSREFVFKNYLHNDPVRVKYNHLLFKSSNVSGSFSEWLDEDMELEDEASDSSSSTTLNHSSFDFCINSPHLFLQNESLTTEFLSDFFEGEALTTSPNFSADSPDYSVLEDEDTAKIQQQQNKKDFLINKETWYVKPLSNSHISIRPLDKRLCVEKSSLVTPEIQQQKIDFEKSIFGESSNEYAAKQVRKGTRTTQTARKSTGGKAPRVEQQELCNDNISMRRSPYGLRSRDLAKPMAVFSVDYNSNNNNNRFHGGRGGVRGAKRPASARKSARVLLGDDFGEENRSAGCIDRDRRSKSRSKSRERCKEKERSAEIAKVHLRFDDDGDMMVEHEFKPTNIFSLWKKVVIKSILREVKNWSPVNLRYIYVISNQGESVNRNILVDISLLFDSLDLCGIKSLGTNATTEIQKLILNLILCYIYIRLVKESSQPISCLGDLRDAIAEPCIGEIVLRIEQTITKQPLVCSNLELSRNWDAFIQNWFQI